MANELSTPPGRGSVVGDVTPPFAASGGSPILVGVVACFFLSGFAALLYQTAWLRQFSVVFGTNELAVATVLAAYMGGLAGGAAIAGRFAARLRRPILIYGLLEAGIAVSALAVPFLLAAAGTLYVALLGGQAEPPTASTLGQPFYYLIVGFVVLALPTGFMGATLPLLTRYAVRCDRQVGPRVALLYAINTAGAVLGTLATAFVLLPAVGLSATVGVGVGVNALVFVIAALLARGSDNIDAAASSPPQRPKGSLDGHPEPPASASGPPRARPASRWRQPTRWILPLMLLSGANAFFYEILWTRMLTHVVGGSIYAFATMLAAFLAGIALGSGVAGRFAGSPRAASFAFGLTQLAIGTLSIGVYTWMQALIPATRGASELAAYAVAVMLPATMFIGATFPLAVRILARNETDVAAATGRIYAWNTTGAIAGSVLAGFVLIPLLGFAASVRLAVLINLALALVTALSVAPKTRLAVGGATAAFVLAAVVFHPSRPQSVILNTGFAVSSEPAGTEVYFAVGRSATVLLIENDGEFDLRTNGLPEASILMRGAPPLGQTQQWLSALPIAARPDARDMLAIGFGGGVALQNVPSSIRSIDAIEIEQHVIDANRRIAGRRVADPLDDERVNIVVNDARNALRLTDKRYDIIASQPSHPWTAGASHLFSREFMQQAKNHLTDNGVFVQWMSAGFVDEALLRSLTATLLDTFDNVRVYHAGASNLLFMASDDSLDIELQLSRTGRPLTEHLLYYAYMGLNTLEDFVAALLLDERGAARFAAGAPLTTDDRNLMAMRSRALSDGLSLARLLELLAPYDPLLDPGGWVQEQLGGELHFSYIAARLLAGGQTSRAARLADAVGDASTRSMIAGLVRGSTGELDRVNEAFAAALASDPDNDGARFALLEPELAALAAGRASPQATALARDLGDSAAAVVRGWHLAANADWTGLASLDGELARAGVTDLWFPYATQLRADWRTKVGTDREAVDALRMIDRALLIRPSVSLYVLRAAAADITSDSHAFAETCRHLADFIEDGLRTAAQGRGAVSRTEVDADIRRLIALRTELLRLPTGPDARPTTEVAEKIERLIVRLQSAAR